MEHASPRIRNVDEGGYNLRSTQVNTTHLSGPDTVLDPEFPSNAFATAVSRVEEVLEEASPSPPRTADVTSSPASRTPYLAGAEAQGEHAGDARLPLDPSSAATFSRNVSGQQNNQTESGEVNLQQQEGGSNNPLITTNSDSAEGIWFN